MKKKIDYRDLMLQAIAEVQQIVREIMEELDEPQREAMKRQLWMQLPNEMKEKIEREEV